MTTFGLLKTGFFGFAAIGSVLIMLTALIRRRLGHVSIAILGIILTGFIVLIDSHYIEPNWIKVERVKIKDKALARVVGDTRIVHITDIHLTDGIRSRERKLVKMVNKLEPDIIFFTGDIIDDLSQVGPCH